LGGFDVFVNGGHLKKAVKKITGGREGGSTTLSRRIGEYHLKSECPHLEDCWTILTKRDEEQVKKDKALFKRVRGEEKRGAN